MLETIYVTRHGFRADWITPDFPSPTGLPHDPPLADIGARQARELAAFLGDKPIERIYSSPFYRCLQTTNEVAEKLDLDINVESGLSEWYGTERTFYPRPADLVILNGFFPRIDTSYVPMVALPQDGSETEAQCHDRVRITMERIISSCDGAGPQGPRSILLVGHAASVICIVRALLADPNVLVKSGTCCVFEFKKEAGGWRMVKENDSSFLSEQDVVRSWTFDGNVPSYEQNTV